MMLLKRATTWGAKATKSGGATSDGAYCSMKAVSRRRRDATTGRTAFSAALRLRCGFDQLLKAF